MFHLSSILGAVATSDYVSLLKSFPELKPLPLLSLFLLAFMRIAPVVSIAPFLAAKMPGAVKMMLVICLTLIFLPQILMQTHMVMAFDLTFIGYALKELFIGFILAFLISIPFHIASSAGILIDFLRGSSALQIGDPTLQNQSSPIGILYNQILIVIFYQIDGPFLFFDAMMQTYNYLPIDKLLPASFYSIQTPFWQTIVGLLTKVTALSIQFSAPPLVAILMAEMFLGIANRLAPQVQIAFLGMAIKSLLGVFLLWAGWQFILQQIAKDTLAWISEISRILSSM